MAEGKQVTSKDLELDANTIETYTFNLREVRERAERRAILRALGHSGGKVTHAADMLGISRPTMYDLIRKLNLKV
jgi:two-component system NtrC family response regulator